MRPRIRLLEIVSAVIAIIALIVALSNSGGNEGTTVDKTALSRAVITQPNPACNPALGQGHMGVCSPPSSSLLPLLGAPRVLHGILGVDVSSYQRCADFSGVSFAIVKLNESTGYRDPYAACNIANAKRRRIGNGGYDFLRPGRTSPQAECSVFVQQYRRVGVTGVAVADVEATILGASSTRAYVAAWTACVHRSLPRTTVIHYTGSWFWNPQVGGNAGSSNLWVSAYANGFLLPVGFQSALIWQYSNGSVGAIPRIHGYDSDIFLASRSRFNAVFAGKKPPPAITKGQRKRCTELNTYRRHSAVYHRRYHLKPVKRLPAKTRKRAKTILAGEKKHGIVCKVGKPGHRGTITHK